MALYASLSAFVTPLKLRDQFYVARAGATAAGVRVYAPWFLIAAGVRIGLYLHFGDRGWYDAALITLAAALVHWLAEFYIHGSVTRQQFVAAMVFDGTGFVWMLLARETVTGI